MTGTEIEVIEGELMHAPANLFGTDDPHMVVQKATATANELNGVLRSKQLIVRVGQSDHVKVEGWALLGSMLGVFPVCIWTKPLMKDGKENGWEARVEARTINGQVVGAAEAECTRDENQWGWAPTARNGRTLEPRDDYALRSMAQTRATSKAMRAPLGFIVQLAGFNPTPAEEMPTDGSLLSGSGGEPTARTADEPAPDSDTSDPVLTFGKHKGKKVSDTPDDYRQWLVENFTPKDEHGGFILEAAKDSLVPF